MGVSGTDSAATVRWHTGPLVRDQNADPVHARPAAPASEIPVAALVDIESLASLLNDFSALVGMTTALLDPEGNILLGAGWQRACTGFHRVSPASCANCTESDLFLAKHLGEGEFVDYKCRNGLWDVVTPVFVGPRHLGNLYCGQFFYDDDVIDEGFFIAQAERHGYDLTAYLAAIRDIPRFSREYVRRAMGFMAGLASYLSDLSLSSLRLQASEHQFRTLAENSPNIIVRYDRDCRRIYVNPAYLQQTEKRREEVEHGVVLDRHWRPDITVPVEEYKARLRQVMATGTRTEFHMGWTQQATGEVVHHALHIVPEYDLQGKVVGTLAIGHNITALKEAEARLLESHALLREVSARRETAREEERKRIAREIHDELGQQLTALRMGISMLRLQFGQDNPLLAERVEGLMALTDRTIGVVRDVTSALRPAVLDMGLSAALDWLVVEFRKHAGIPCRLRTPEGRILLAEDRAAAVFRVVQESLTNVARHSGASRVEVALEQSGHEVRLEVMDNGKGFDPAVPRKDAFGLLSMRERGFMLGGEVDIVSAPGQGAAVRLRFPLCDIEEEI